MSDNVHFASEKEVDPASIDIYLDALKSMHSLLGELGEQHWRSWIDQDLQEWETNRSTDHHLSAYGGMGSFNDLAFEDVWLDCLFYDLKSVCYHFAQHPTGDMNIHNDQMGSIGFDLSGWRCLDCGYSVVSNREIQYFIARRVIRKNILSAVEHRELTDFVGSVIRTRPMDELLTMENLTDWGKQSGLNIRDQDDWLRPCPNCGSHNTAVYRWLLESEDGYRFVPSDNNLPLRINEH